jgi:ribose-phosphate pyrophosphokinase
MLTKEGIDKLRDSAIEELVTTDSVPGPDWDGYPVTVLSVSELMAEAIVRVHNNQSVTSLFRV